MIQLHSLFLSILVQYKRLNFYLCIFGHQYSICTLPHIGILRHFCYNMQNDHMSRCGIPNLKYKIITS